MLQYAYSTKEHRATPGNQLEAAPKVERSSSCGDGLARARFGAAERRAVHALLAAWALEELVAQRQQRATENQYGHR